MDAIGVILEGFGTTPLQSGSAFAAVTAYNKVCLDSLAASSRQYLHAANRNLGGWLFGAAIL